MILQASNKPLVIFAKYDLSNATEIHVDLHINNKVLRHWDEDEIEVDGQVLICPLTQTETAAFPAKRAYCSVKWLNENNVVDQMLDLPISIGQYHDKHIMGDDEPNYIYDIVYDGDLSECQGILTPEAVKSAVVIKAGYVTGEVANAAVATWMNAHKAELKGDKGDDGSDANVTAANIQTALGYVPAKEAKSNAHDAAIYVLESKANSLESDVDDLEADVSALQNTKQNKLTAGENIAINGNVISAIVHDPYDDTSIRNTLAQKQDKLIAGANVTLSGNTISVHDPYDDEELRNSISALQSSKQNSLNAGDNISIVGSTISVTGLANYDDTAVKGRVSSLETEIEKLASKQELNIELAKKQDTLTAGENVTIINGVISSRLNEEYDDTELRAELATKQDKLTAGDNIEISGNTINATLDNFVSDLAGADGTTVIAYTTDGGSVTVPTVSEMNTELAKKQNVLTAGDNISIENNVISVVGDVDVEVTQTLTDGVEIGSVDDVTLYAPEINYVDAELDSSGDIVLFGGYDDEGNIKQAVNSYRAEVNALTTEVAGKQPLLSTADKQEIADMHVDPDTTAFITKAVSDLTNYYTKSNTYTKTEVNSLVSAIPKFAISVVSELPTSDISNTTIYIVKTSETESGNLYTEYIRANNAWEKLGTQTMDLSGYMTKAQLLDAGIKSITWSTVLEETTVTTVEDPLKEQRPDGTNTRYYVDVEKNSFMSKNRIYNVIFNGTEYKNLQMKYGIIRDAGTVHNVIGNRYLYDSRYEDTGEPFCLLSVGHDIGNTNQYYYTVPNRLVIFTRDATTFSIKIECGIVQLNKLHPILNDTNQYIDDIVEGYGNSSYSRTSLGIGNIVGRNSFAIGMNAISTGFGSIAESGSNAIGDFSHAEGNESTASGKYSHSEGCLTVASGQFSHSEGGYVIDGETKTVTESSGYGSHAEGFGCKATKQASHAEGQLTTSSGSTSHSEGYSTTASGDYSHAEGYLCVSSNNATHSEGAGCNASGMFSHSEGAYSVSSGMISHSEGYGTKASSNYQHVQGKYNVEDSNSTYAHIVGNGTSEDSRSNAHTLDWNGNAWYAGTVEGTSAIIKSPDGSRWQLSVDNDGVLTTTKLGV